VEKVFRDKAEVSMWVSLGLGFGALVAGLCYVLYLDYGRTVQSLRHDLAEERARHADDLRALRSCRVAANTCCKPR
jgi:hypothetical protein